MHDPYLYLGGSRARCVDVQDGTLLSDVAFDAEVTVLPPVNEGPVYSTGSGGIIMGLAPITLAKLWDWPDPNEEFTAFNVGLCRYK